MRALVIMHDQQALPVAVGQRLEQRGFELDPFVVVEDAAHPVSHRPFPHHGGYDLLVPMGAPWSVYDTATIGTWIHRELELLRDAHESGTPVLGICFGGQALAAALGGRVEKGPEPEIGWFQVRTDAPELVPAGPWFEWHTDRFEPPPGAEVLAATDVAPQAYRVGRSLGLQFHPEVDGDLIDSWVRVGGPDNVEQHGVDPAALVAETHRQAPAAHPRTHRLVDAFLDRIAFPDGLPAEAAAG